MTVNSATFGILLGLSLLTIFYSESACQTPVASTQNEVWPEADIHIQLPTNWRVLAFAGLEQGVGYPFQQWYAAAALGYQFKPILRPHWENIDPDKEHYFLFGGGYEFLRTSDLGSVTHENRVTLDLTFNFRPLARLLVHDRNWVELRWIDGIYSTTYRNLVSAEYDLLLHNVRFTPYGSAEFFYGGPDRSWPQEWYTGGVQWPYKRSFMLDTYYRREHCPSCVPQNWNAGGATLNFFFSR